MDMEKIEVEFEFYNFRLESLKKEFERAFRLHTKRMVEKFTQNVIEAAERELPVETAQRIKSISEVTMNLIKPEIIRFLSKLNALIDKYLSIPSDLIIDEEKCLQNTPDMDSYEAECKKDLVALEKAYKQQMLMMNLLKAELELYDGELIAEAEIDMEMCNLYEQHFGDCNDSGDGSAYDGNNSTFPIHNTAVASVLDELSSFGINLN